MAERARYVVLALSFIGHSLCQVGDEVFYDPPEGGHVSANLSPLNDTAQAVVDAQKQDHPAKTANAPLRAAAARAAEEAGETAEQETTNGPLPKNVKPKGDTRSQAAKDKALEKAQAKAAAKAAQGSKGGQDTTPGAAPDDDDDVA